MNTLNFWIAQSNIVTILLYALYTVSSVSGLTLIKFYMSMYKHSDGSDGIGISLLGMGFGFLLYIISFLAWVAILERAPLSTAYPVAIGLTLLFSIISSVFVLNETISLVKSSGIILILLGIILIFRSPT